MKKIISLILSIIIILGMFSVIPFTVSADENITEPKEEEYIYYSDLFYGYSTYLTTNTYLISYEKDTSDITTNVLNEYINTGHFTISAIVQGVSVATDVTAIAKHMSDKMGLSSFELNKELDSANVKFAEAVCNVNLSASAQMSKDNAYVKNLNSFLKIAELVDEIAIVEEANRNKTKPQLYETFFDVTFAYMQDYFTEISPKLPSLKTQMYAAINETAEISGAVAKVADFTKALVLSLAMQETQMELIDDIIATQPTSSTLYKGMTRLKSQLEGKFISYFAGTYCTDFIYEKIVSYVPEIIENSVNDFTPYIPATVQVIKIINNFVLKGLLGFDYSEYTSAIMLTEYANNLNQSIKNKANVFSGQFENSEIKKFETLYNAYIAMKIAAYEECKNLAEHNKTYDEKYMDAVKKYFYIENAYQEYINAVKIFIMKIPKENRKITNHGEWIIKNDTVFSGGSDTVEENKIYFLEEGLSGDIYITSSKLATIPEGINVKINGNLVIGESFSGKLLNYGQLTVTGDITCGGNGSIENVGDLDISGNLTVNGKKGNQSRFGTPHFKMEVNTAKLSVGGNIYFADLLICNITDGETILNGNAQQSITRFKCPILVIKNESQEGVVFNSSISPSVLFDHKANNFTLYNGGSGSTFVDYDGDGLKDNIDPEPTVGNPCTIIIKSEDISEGTVSIDSINTIGGIKHTITATPTFKYHFVKWVNSAGKTVSTSAEYTFVAKNNETLTAVFEKRSQNITVNTNGGVITVPSSAVIESEVSVSFAENEGYIYTDGSLKYNGNRIENGKFIMPDEPVTITAEFVYNEHYFALKDKITEATAIKFNDYTAVSYENLQTAINNANGVLENHITKEVSEHHINALQNAIDGLENKYIVSISVEYSPSLYIGVETLIDELGVLITYDNGTTEYTTEFTVENFDCWQLGEQEITVNYGEFSTDTVVNVQLRQIYDVTYEEIADQLYLGDGTYYEPKPIITYPLTNEVLVENVDYVLYYYDNYTPGKAMIDVIGIGNYEGYISIEFTIYCKHNYEVVEYIAPTCTENGYRKEICSICNDVEDYYYSCNSVFTESLPESNHNYANSTNITYTYQADGAESLELLFSANTKLENNCDYIYIYDINGTQIGKYTGTSLAAKTIKIMGDTVKIKITSDRSVTYYGFSLDSITATYLYEELKATGHTVEDWITVKEPTIYEEGLKQQICSVCGEVVNEESIAKLIYFGDTNGDGEINSVDLINLKIALLFDYNYSDNVACDANGDGVLNILDLVRLKKFLVGIDVPLGSTKNTETQTNKILMQPAYLDTKNALV